MKLSFSSFCLGFNEESHLKSVHINECTFDIFNKPFLQVEKRACKCRTIRTISFFAKLRYAMSVMTKVAKPKKLLQLVNLQKCSNPKSFSKLFFFYVYSLS